MNDFKRIFGYVWPQWPKVLVVVFSAFVVAVLLSVSFMTVIPLLKVMMGTEGLHVWADRKTCDLRYGLDFSLRDATEVFTADDRSAPGIYSLLIAAVQENSLAEAAGFRPQDRIVGVGEYPASKPVAEARVPFSTLLAELAATTKNSIDVRLSRLDQGRVFHDVELVLHTPHDKAYIEVLGWSRFRKAQLAAKAWVASAGQRAVSFVPRQQGRENKTKAVIYIILAVGVLTIIRCLAKFYQGYLAEKIVQIGVNRLREDAFGRVLCMPMSFFVDERPSDTVSRIVRDTNVMGRAVKMMLGKALREPLNAAVMMLVAMLLNWQLTLIFACSAPLVLGLLMVFGRKMKKATRKSLIAGSQMLGKLQETVGGLGVVKVYNQQQHERDSFKRINDRLLKQLLRISRVDAATTPVLEVLGMAAASVALVVGVHWVTQSRMDGSEFLGLLVLLGVAAESVRKTSNVWNRIQEANAAAERVFAVIDQPVEVEKPGAFELPRLRNRVEFANVVFSYPASAEPVLKGVNLTVPAGHNVAIVGPNGAGKTTLANLIPRFYDPDSGQILLDGTDIRDATLSSLRGQIGMVTQHLVTFNDTIAANIAYGKPDAAREEVIAAAKRAYAHEFICLLPDGYDTVIGEHGTGLSGGQLQRIVIARAILKDPAILIFDEATSQVDADSEAKIHKAIEEVMRDRTSFIIAHRFSTVVNADVIVVMDKGQILDQGQHSELIQRCPLYQSLYETQLVST